jgi:hypothetical protein
MFKPCGHFLTGFSSEHRESTCLEMPLQYNPKLLVFFLNSGAIAGRINQSFRRMTSLSATLFTTNTTKIGLHLNTGLDSEAPTTILYTNCCYFLYSTVFYELQDRQQAFK